MKPLQAKLWYLLFFSSVACVHPFYALFFRRQGLRESQVGTLLALRPWVRAPCGYFMAQLADHTATHKRLVVWGWVAQVAFTTSLAASKTFWVLLLLWLACTVGGSPVTVITDAVVLAGQSKGLLDYGQARLWGAVGWGITSFLAGSIYQLTSLYSMFVLNLLLASLSLVMAAQLDFSLLCKGDDGLSGPGVAAPKK